MIDAYVSGLDMAGLGFLRSVTASTGRPPYDPRDLLKLYVYGYFNEVRSLRKLERECQRNVEAMWLLNRLSLDFKTIADFRRDNGPAIVATCRNFVEFCCETGLGGPMPALCVSEDVQSNILSAHSNEKHKVGDS